MGLVDTFPIPAPQKSSQNYQSHFPPLFESLLGFYLLAMTEREPAKIEHAIHDLHIYTENLKLMRDAGIFTEFFLKKFQEDIGEIRKIVGSEITDKSVLTYEQSSLYFMMANFENYFKVK